MTDVLALDIATTTGFARGLVGGKPQAGSVTFGRGESKNQVYANALTWFSGLLEPLPRPDLIAIEDMLPPQAMKGETSRAVRDRLAGLHGIMRAVAHLRGIHRIEAVTVSTIRAHFIGDRTLRRIDAKAAVIERCRMLGWQCRNDNEADALALWSCACGMLRPETALRVTPLFA
jgi:hypothetical protein